MLHPGSRFQMAGDLLETYLLWLIEAHAHVSEAGRVRIRPGHAECPDRYMPSAQPSHRGGHAYRSLLRTGGLTSAAWMTPE